MVGPKGSLRIKAGEIVYVVPLDAGDHMFSKFTVYPKSPGCSPPTASRFVRTRR
jgi:hypothetical protein